MFSTTDLLRGRPKGNRAAQDLPPVPGCVCSDWAVVEPDRDAFPADAVSRYMTPDPVLVPPATPLGRLARLMVDAQVHRLIVAGEDRRPMGVVTGTDLLAAAARAARERQ